MTAYSTVVHSAGGRSTPVAGTYRTEKRGANIVQGVEQHVEAGNGTRTSQASISAALSAANAGASAKLAAAVRFPGEDGGSSLAAMAQSDLDAALQLLADRAQYITGANGAAIALRRAGKNDMMCRASTGANVPELGALLSTEFGLSGESVRTRRALRCDDAERDPRVNREGCRQLGIASVVVMPVVNDDEVMGVFELFSGKVNAFGERDLSALQRLSEMVETAVKLARAAESVPAMAPEELVAEAAVARDQADDQILGEEVLEVQNLELPMAELGEKSGLGDSGAKALAEEDRPIAVLEALRDPNPDSSLKADSSPKGDGVAADVETPAAGEAALSGQAAVPKKPLFWSAAMNPVAEGEKAAEPDQSHVPPVLRNLRTCEACGFPVSPGRALCVECEEKRWRGQLKRPSARLPLSAGLPAGASAAPKSKPPLLAKDARNGAPGVGNGVPAAENRAVGNGASAVEVAASGPVARLVAAAAQSGAAAAPARESVAVTVSPAPAPAIPSVLPDLPRNDKAGYKEVAVPVPTAVPVNSLAGEMAPAAVVATAEDSSPEFVLSAGLEPQRSWLLTSVYVMGVLAVVAAAVAATILLH